MLSVGLLKKAGHALVLDCEAQGLNMTKLFDRAAGKTGSHRHHGHLAGTCNALTIAAELKTRYASPSFLAASM